MYTDAEFWGPYFQEFSEEVQQLLHDELYHPSSMIDTFCEYGLGEHGDLLRAPEPIFEEPILGPMEDAISMISIADQNLIPTQNQEDENSQSLPQIGEITTLPATLFCDVQTEEKQSLQNSVSTASFNSSMLPLSLLDYGMRRAFSEGDIKALSCSYEDRQQKLCRYRIKKMKRNFGRKITYARRKAIADSQPRIRGRFARNASKCVHMEELAKY